MVLKRQLPATLSGELDNPFRGDRHALRDKAIEYSALYDRILSAMQ